MKIRVDHHVQLCSYGGVATSFLQGYLKKSGLLLPEGKDSGIWKHMRKPPSKAQYDLPNDYRVVYLVGDPVKAIISVFRRLFQVYHVDRMQCEIKNFPPTWELNSSKPINWWIEDYGHYQKDLFQMEAHFMNWTQSKMEHDYPILVIKNDRLWQNLDVLFDFLKIPKSQMGDFPAQKIRKSDHYPILMRKKKDLDWRYGILKLFEKSGIPYAHILDSSLFHPSFTFIKSDTDPLIHQLTTIHANLIEKMNAMNDYQIIRS